MSFADELRKMPLSRMAQDKASEIVNGKIREYVLGLKNLCIDEAKKGKNGISGYVNLRWEEYANSPDVYITDESIYKFEPVKKNGSWEYILPELLDYGVNSLRFDTSNQERYNMAIRIRDGIIKELGQCGFSKLDVDIVRKPYYEKYMSMTGKSKYKKSDNIEVHVMRVAISWK